MKHSCIDVGIGFSILFLESCCCCCQIATDRRIFYSLISHIHPHAHPRQSRAVLLNFHVVRSSGFVLSPPRHHHLSDSISFSSFSCLPVSAAHCTARLDDQLHMNTKHAHTNEKERKTSDNSSRTSERGNRRKERKTHTSSDKGVHLFNYSSANRIEADPSRCRHQTSRPLTTSPTDARYTEREKHEPNPVASSFFVSRCFTPLHPNPFYPDQTEDTFYLLTLRPPPFFCASIHLSKKTNHNTQHTQHTQVGFTTSTFRFITRPHTGTTVDIREAL